MGVLGRPRQWFRLLVLMCALIFLLTIWDRCSEPHRWAGVESTSVSFPPEQLDFWSRFIPILIAGRPNAETPKRPEDAGALEVGFGEVKKDDNLQDVIRMPAEDVIAMRSAHSWVVEEIKNHAPPLYYRPGTRGIVTTAGGAYIPIVVVSLRMLRKTGSTLPVEVFLADEEEYDPYLCETIFPALNARCRILSDIFNSVPALVKIEHYQYKIAAMLLSSFEDILFLDADDIVLRKPESFFDEEPYRSSHLVTWPDFWAITTSPHYYNIASQPACNLSAHASTESGQIFISRKTHGHALMLAMYYNLYGPSHYYPLFSQGSPGEGDKETFVAAASVMNSSFYQVHKGVRAIGFFDDGGFHGTAMVQHDPLDDYIINVKKPAGNNAPRQPRALFIHANFPKLSPDTLLDSWVTKDTSGKQHRIWGSENDTMRDFGFDVERMAWEEMVWTGCELEQMFGYWANRTGICEKVKGYWKEVFVGENGTLDSQ